MGDKTLDGLQVRAATVTEVDEDQGLVEVKIVPYELETQLGPNYWEVFTKGAFSAATGNPGRCKMSNMQHDRANPIGVALELRDLEDGCYGTIHIPKTDVGERVLTLMRAHVLDEISVEFEPQKRHRREVWQGNELHIRHDRATLVGLSQVSAGAYGQNARVLSMRSASDLARESELAYLASLNAGPVRA
jgi:HK97 family phage prohead protease